MGDRDYENDTGAGEKRRRGAPSLPLLAAGIAAVLVSAWALIGPDTFDVFTGVDVRWAFVVIAVIIGFALVLAPVRRLREGSRRGGS